MEQFSNTLAQLKPMLVEVNIKVVKTLEKIVIYKSQLSAVKCIIVSKRLCETSLQQT